MVELAIAGLAKRDMVPKATKAAELLREALELEEDYMFGQIALAREKSSGKYVSHKNAWRQSGK